MESIEVYAGYCIKQDIRISSSSGAVFSVLAEYVLEQDGVVYGVKMTEDCYSAEFARVTEVSGLAKLRGSKYLQAKMGNTYKQVREDLIEGRLVLFSGTGCQVNGLKSFLQNHFDNLICVDVICHGVPSPALWKKYARYQEEKNGGKLKNINFRCKDESYKDSGIKAIIDAISQEKLKSIYISKDEDPYMTMFLRDYCLRPSCYDCIAKNVKMADLTIGDFWGINDVAPDMNDGNGTSLILIRTDKGRKIFEVISSDLKLKKVSYEDGVNCNPAEYKSCCRPSQREIFFENVNVMSFEELKKKYAAPIKVSFKSRVKGKIKHMIKTILRVTGDREDVNKMRNMDYSLRFVFECQEKDS